jgi:hypothetical protein
VSRSVSFLTWIGLFFFLGNLPQLSAARGAAKAKKLDALRASLLPQRYLRAMNEPSLRRLAEMDRGATVYRFVWMPSFHDAISVRFVKSDQGVILHAVRLTHIVLRDWPLGGDFVDLCRAMLFMSSIDVRKIWFEYGH